MKKIAWVLALCLVMTVCLPVQASALTIKASGVDKLEEGIERAANGDTVILVSSTELLKAPITIAAGKNITIDLNGYHIYDIQYAMASGNLNKEMKDQPVFIISSGATVTLKSSSRGGEIRNRAEGGIGITNNGTLIIQSGEVSSTGKDAFGIKNNGTLTFSAGTVSASGKNGVAVANNGTMTMNGGAIDAGSGDYCKGVVNTGTVNMTSGGITADCRAGYGIHNQGGTISFTGGNITVRGSGACGIYNENGKLAANTGVIYCSGSSSQSVYTGSGATSATPGTPAGSGGNSAGTAAGVTAVPTASTVYVNGTAVGFDAYLINGNNYFKLRDVATALNGTNKQFEVNWSEETQTITLIGGQAYTSVGGEMSGKGTTVQTAKATSHQTYYNKIKQDYKAYNIMGNNYFKLRDLGQSMNFDVTWDGAKNAVMIDTFATYTAD